VTVETIVFSRDRPAQLDLCLRSIRAHLPDLAPVTVIHRSSGPAFADGYELCRAQHPEVTFVAETDFRRQVLALLASSGSHLATFLCDDDVAFRAPNLGLVRAMMDIWPTILCFSLRLGANTTQCYSLRKSQEAPPTDTGKTRSGASRHWSWRGAEGDWGYPGSLDGHIWRREQVLTLISSRTNWGSPNELEDALNQACQTALLPEMASFAQSCLTGVPVNSVQSSHDTNRHGERFHADPRTINDRYLQGARLSLDSVVPALVDAAHTEFQLKWAA
jgi:hypothetical protein